MVNWKRLIGFLGGLGIVFCLTAQSSEPFDWPSGLSLGLELSEERDYYGAAIEFRRAGLRATVPAEQGNLFWLSAHAYQLDGRIQSAEAMLDRAEDSSPEVVQESLLLRGILAEERKAWLEAVFYYRSVAELSEDEELNHFAARRAAAASLRAGDPEEARVHLEKIPEQPEAIKALRQYREGRDKAVRLGGVLGMIPGLGYAYAGEFANALRSLLLNSLFLYGMVDTATKDQWGAFAILSFFEITWYSGSIYGGIDASDRYNRQRLEEAARAVAGPGNLQPELQQWPLFRVRLTF